MTAQILRTNRHIVITNHGMGALIKPCRIAIQSKYEGPVRKWIEKDWIRSAQALTPDSQWSSCNGADRMTIAVTTEVGMESVNTGKLSMLALGYRTIWRP
jgi:hypothetical protein